MNLLNGTSLFEGSKPIVDDGSIKLITEGVSTVDLKVLKDKLYQFGIFEAEQIVALTNNDINLLAESVEIEAALLEEIVNKSKIALGEKANVYLSEGYRRSLGLYDLPQPGLITEGLNLNEFFVLPSGDAVIDTRTNAVFTTLTTPFQISLNLNYLDRIRNIKDQGSHPTCAAFAATSSNEFTLTYNVHRFLKGYFHLSESSLYCEAKRYDNITYENGTTLYHIAHILRTVGQAKTNLYPYGYMEANVCTNHNYRSIINHTDIPNQRTGSVAIESKNVGALQKVLSIGYLPYIGIKLFDSVWNARTTESGFINMPLLREPEVGAHAICLVGYFSDLNLPGGGAFIFKNSWGMSWAYNNIFNRSGYGILPFKYIEDYGMEAYVAV